MRRLTLRTKLTLFYSIIVSLLLTGFALLSYRVLAVGVDNDLTQDILDRTSGLRGYLRFTEGQPVFVYDSQVRFSPSDITHYAETSPSFVDIHTDQENIRVRHEVVSSEGGGYLLFVG